MTDVVRKALSLLNVFSVTRPEIGLSDCARLTGHDKATTHRLLTTLCEEGLIEQHPDTRRYRLGAGILVLARIREASFPFAATAQTMLDTLSETTGETAHCSLYSNGTLAVIASVESRKANRVSMRGAEILPFHATASGLAFLAFAPASVVADALSQPMTAYTLQTCTDRDALLSQVERARQVGYAVADRSYEDDVVGFAAPVFGPHQTAVGAVAVACPSHRWTQASQARLYKGVLDAAVTLSRAMGNEPPKRYLQFLDIGASAGSKDVPDRVVPGAKV